MTTTKTDAQTVLLPCPFCGNHDFLAISNGMFNCGQKTYYVECPECAACSGSFLLSAEEAIKAWNTRVPAAQRLVGGWLPIESAPKKKGVFLLGFDSRSKDVFVMQWGCFLEGSKERNQWANAKHEESVYPTHFMHLPTQPTSEEV